MFTLLQSLIPPMPDITDVRCLEVLKGLKLEVLNVEGNPLCKQTDLRKMLSEMMPSLRELDGTQINC